MEPAPQIRPDLDHGLQPYVGKRTLHGRPALIGALGLVLLYYRATNREPPRLNLFGEGRVFAR